MDRDDEVQRLAEELRIVHTQGKEAHQRFGDIAAMGATNAEHQKLAAAARELTTRLREAVDAHFAPLSKQIDM